MELSGRCNLRMGSHIVCLIVEHHFRRVHTVEIEGDVGQGVGFDFQVGHDAASIPHLPSVAGMEHVCEAVGNALGIAPSGMFIVDGLHTASAGDVILARGDLHIAVIGQVEGSLHQSLPVRART